VRVDDVKSIMVTSPSFSLAKELVVEVKRASKIIAKIAET